jgi:Fe-S-cluster containining protein
MAESEYIDCREGCGACCIALSISSSIPGMEQGKPAGVRCIHLMEDYKCALFGKPERPAVCGDFRAETLFCGTNRDEAMKILLSLSD